MGKLSIKHKRATGAPWRLLYTWDSYEDLEAIKLIPGGVVGSSSVTFPLSLEIFDIIEEHIPGVIIDADATAWADSNVLKRKVTDLARASTASEKRIDLDPKLVKRAADLYNFQTVGAHWLHTIKRGILGDDPGLGKTITSYTAAALSKPRRILVITLTSQAVQNQWKETAEKWFGWSAIIARGTPDERRGAFLANAKVTIMPVTMLAARKVRGKRGPVVKVNQYEDLLFSRPWDVIIVDEAHTLQNPQSEQSKGAKKLQSDYLFLLTGTPLWNRAGSVWHLLHLLQPSQYTSYWAFVNSYCKVTETKFGRKVGDVMPHRVIELRNELAPHILRRTVDDVFDDLPDVVVNPRRYELPAAMYKVLRTMKKDRKLVINDQVVKEYVTISPILSDMRKFCSMPQAFGMVDVITPKDEEFMQIVTENLEAGKRMLIFTWHRSYCEYVCNKIQEVEKKTAYIHGGIPQAGRDKNISDIKNSKLQVLVATMPTLGVGVDLPMLDVVLFLESDYTPAMIEQAWRRIYRIGSKGTRFVYFLLGRNTIEERIFTIFSKKKQVAESVLLQESIDAEIDD